MIRLEHITKEYTSGKHSIRALQKIDLEIPAGEIFGLIGYSGAGKSTLLRTINLLESPTEGNVWVEDVALNQLGKRQLQVERRKIGMIFQHFHLLHSATVADNIAFPLKLAKLPKQEVSKRVTELLQLVGLSGYESKYPAQLSGGQKQRVAIARALANEPKVLLSDEATSALDPETTNSILQLLLEINQRLGLTIVLVTHEMSVIRKVCDRVAVMANGQIVEQGRVEEVFLAPKHDVTRGMLGILDGTVNPYAERAQTGKRTLLQISYAGALTYSPVLADVAQETNCSFSILQGSVDTLKNTPFGRLTVEWFGSLEGQMKAIERLRDEGCVVEILSFHGTAEDALKELVEVGK